MQTRFLPTARHSKMNFMTPGCISLQSCQRKCPALWTNGKAFLRVVLAVFVGVRAVNEEKGRPTDLGEIDHRRVAQMLHNPVFKRLPLELAPHNPPGDQVKIILGRKVADVFVRGKIRR
jgi:hypothetical protein